MPSVFQLQALCAAVEKPSLRQAAEALCKTQPALTHALKQLESQLGLTLFNRDGYRLVLTGNGERIYQLALKTLESHAEIEQLAQHLARGDEDRVVLTVEASFELTPILRALESVQAEFSQTEIVIQQEYLTGAVERVQQGQANLAITPLAPALSPGTRLDTKPLSQGQMLNVAAPRLLARYPALSSIEQLRKEYQILVQDSGSGTLGLKLGVQTAQRHWYVNSFATKLSLIEQGMGWGRLPEWMLTEALATGRLRVLELADFPTRQRFEYHLVRRSAAVPGPVATRLWQRLGGSLL